MSLINERAQKDGALITMGNGGTELVPAIGDYAP